MNPTRKDGQQGLMMHYDSFQNSFGNVPLPSSLREKNVIYQSSWKKYAYWAIKELNLDPTMAIEAMLFQLHKLKKV